MARVICPKCNHRPPLPIGDNEACPACGVFMHKLVAPGGSGLAREARLNRATKPVRGQWLLLQIPGSGLIENRARALLLAVLTLWGVYLASRDITTGEIGQSFMHNILLVIHEAGHVLFMPFGEFLMIAGGSLFQVALPFAIAVAFLVKNRDPFGAAVCLWWTGISLIDLAPYVYDALQPQLILLGGRTGEDGPHDWIYLFETLGGLRYAHGWGRVVQVAGILVAFGALLWAALAVWHTHRHPSDAKSEALLD